MDVHVSFWIANQVTSNSSTVSSDGNARTRGCMYPSDPSESYSHLVIQRMIIGCIFRVNSTDLVAFHAAPLLTVEMCRKLHPRAGLAGRLGICSITRARM